MGNKPVGGKDKEKELNSREVTLREKEIQLKEKLTEVDDQKKLLDEDRNALNSERKSFEEMAAERTNPSGKVVFASLNGGTLREQCDKVLADCGAILGHISFEGRAGGDSSAPVDIAYSKIESAIASLNIARDKSQ